MKTLRVCEDIKKLFLIFRSDDGNMVIFFKEFICYTEPFTDEIT